MFWLRVNFDTMKYTNLNKTQTGFSPLPWHDDADEQGEIYDAAGRCIADNLHPDNAALIVRAVNYAPALAEALRAWEYAGNEGGISMVDWFEVARKKTREALAAYEIEAQ